MHTILIVEDEQILRAAYKKILTQEGFNVHTAPDGAAALKKVAKVKPDLILLDIIMPHMDGLAFLKQVRHDHRLPDVKIIAFSNLSDQSKMDEMQTMGAVTHILKSSLSPKQLVSSIRAMLLASQET